MSVLHIESKFGFDVAVKCYGGIHIAKYRLRPTIALQIDDGLLIRKLEAQTNESTKRAEEAATQARAKQARANTTTTPTNQYRREASVVKEQSLLENLTTQLTGVQKTTGEVMGGVAGSAQVVGQNIQQVVEQNIQSLFENFSPFGGPAKAEAPRVDGPGNKKANTEPFPRQVQGPRPEERKWTQIVTSNERGGRGGGGGRG